MRPPPIRGARRLAALALAALLAACGTTPELYLLPPPAPAARLATPVASIAVADISLPAYAEAPEIATLAGPGEVSLDRGASWADTPRRALTRHLAAALEARLGADVVPEPWPGFDPPGLRIEVAVDRLIGAAGTGVEFSGQYVVLTPSSGRIFATERFDLAVPAPGEGNAALLAAHARAIEALADRIARRIATGRTA